MATKQPTDVRARSLLTRGKVHVADAVKVVVEGSNGDNYTVTWEGSGWVCECVGYAYRRDCYHVAAVRLITSPPGQQ